MKLEEYPELKPENWRETLLRDRMRLRCSIKITECERFGVRFALVMYVIGIVVGFVGALLMR